MALTRRDFLLGGVAATALGVSAGTSLIPSLEKVKKERNKSVTVSFGETAWNVPVHSEGEPFLTWLEGFFQLEYKQGPWDNFEGRLLVYVSDKDGNVVVGENLGVVVNRSIVPNIGLDYLVARQGDFYEINSVEKLAAKYPFFQLQS